MTALSNCTSRNERCKTMGVDIVLGSVWLHSSFLCFDLHKLKGNHGEKAYLVASFVFRFSDVQTQLWIRRGADALCCILRFQGFAYASNGVVPCWLKVRLLHPSFHGFGLCKDGPKATTTKLVSCILRFSGSGYVSVSAVCSILWVCYYTSCFIVGTS